MPDCVDFRFKTPEMVYVSKVWSMEDLFEHIKRGEPHMIFVVGY